MYRNRKEEDVGFIQWDSLEHSVMEGGWEWLFQGHWGAPHVGHSHSVHLIGAQVRDTVVHKAFTKIDCLVLWVTLGCRSSRTRQICTRCGWKVGKIPLCGRSLGWGFCVVYSFSQSL